ncbi:prolyl oligopeptidase [Sphingopyxis sp. YR583]|uniref:prolyl oligopeptidase family serine peptidase n=1 Tax=Sphingopyxis sp. YR583 TaxID=1881047 RepID=UPI0008A7F870|nr:prolyl oligopeptidase family serine peptidase [Sphingopyxis sp. YR583]SEH13908.1 prolyl oligopeptidase [Sphingopyxis sp. YR583]
MTQSGDQGREREALGWLEEDSDPATIAWQEQANALTVDELAASPNAAAVTEVVRNTFVDLFTTTAPERFGDIWFRKVQPAGQGNVVLTASSEPTGQGRLLVDPGLDGPNANLAVCLPSPDGMMVLVGIDVDGDLRCRLVKVADGTIIRTFENITQAGLCAWAPDNDGFFYQALGITTIEGQMVPQMQVWWQPLTGEAEQQAVDLNMPFAWPMTARESRWLAITGPQTGPRPQWIKRHGDSDWTRFLPDASAMYRGAFIGDEYWAITDDTSGWCRLVAIPLASADDRSTWREILADHEECKLLSITRCGDYVALATIEGGAMRLKSLDIKGNYLGAVPLPEGGAFGVMPLGYIGANMFNIVGADGNGCTFVHSTLDSGPSVYRADLASLSLEQLEPPANRLADREVRSFVVEGPHGPVTYWVMRKASVPLDGSAAAIVTGYGGFNMPELPHYIPMAAAWTELGGIWVHCQLRGGGERDTEFWHAGRMHRKQGTFDDFYAVLADIHARGITTPERTGIWGTSNGGLLVNVAVTQRPELIGAAVAQVPVSDLMALGRDPVSLNIVKADYGDPDVPADVAAMRAYSPIQNIRAGVRYPALLCDAGAHDPITPPWHSRKMVAAIEAASVSGRRVRLRVRDGAGHNQMTAERFMQRDIDELIFFCDELGMKLGQPSD